MKFVVAADGIRMIGLIFNDELFGQELANIAVYRTLAELGAHLRVGAQYSSERPEVGDYLRMRSLESFKLPYGSQWSKKFFKREPSLFFKNVAAIRKCSGLLKKEIHEFNPTHLMISDSLIYSYIFPTIRNRRFKFIFRTGDIAPVESKPQLFLWRKCVSRADRIVVNSKFVMESVLESADTDVSSKTSLIYNFPPNGASEFNRRERGFEKRLVILYVGQISEHKGVHHFVKSAITLCEETDRVDFWVVGGSKHTSRLESELKQLVGSHKLEGRILFLGKSQNPAEFYKSADLLVVPTIGEEPAANVVLEAMSFGVPSVVYKSGGLPELVEHDVTGVVCKQRDFNALSTELRRLIKDPGRITRMRDGCLKVFEPQFGKERFVQEWMNALLKN